MQLPGGDEKCFVNELLKPRDGRVSKKIKKKKNFRKRKTGTLKLENESPEILKLENESMAISLLPLFDKYQSTRGNSMFTAKFELFFTS